RHATKSATFPAAKRFLLIGPPTCHPERSEGSAVLPNPSKILPQIHPGIQARHLIGVAVEHERFLTTEHADPSFTRLRPAGVIDLGIHVRVEAVLVGIRDLPGVRGLLLDE